MLIDLWQAEGESALTRPKSLLFTFGGSLNVMAVIVLKEEKRGEQRITPISV